MTCGAGHQMKCPFAFTDVIAAVILLSSFATFLLNIVFLTSIFLCILVDRLSQRLNT